MKRITLSIVLFLICSFATAASQLGMGPKLLPKQAWEDSPDISLDVHWHRTVSGLPWVEEGVCHVIMGDDERDMETSQLMEQFRSCITKGATKTLNTPLVDGAQRVRLYTLKQTSWVGRQDAMWEHLQSIYEGMERPKPTSSSFCMGKCTPSNPVAHIFDSNIEAAFFKRNEYCGIVVDQDTAVGHEFKHCVDGLFHDDHGRWIKK